MKNLPELKKLHLESKAIYNSKKELLYNVMTDSDIVKTANVLHSFVNKGDYFTDAFFDLAPSRNIYASNVLLRSFIEHHLRFKYILMKTVEGERNDVMGETYLTHLHANEDSEAMKAWQKIGRLVTLPDEKNPSIEFKRIKNLDGEVDYKESNRQSEQFQYKKIIEYLNQTLSNETEYRRESFFLNLIPFYSKLSSFVHGGPVADRYMTRYIMGDTLEKEQLILVNTGVSINISMKAITFKLFEGEFFGFEEDTLKLKSMFDQLTR